MKLFYNRCSAKGKSCSLCNIYIRVGLICFGILWIWGNITVILALLQNVPIPSNAETQAAILGDILIPVIILIQILKRKKKTL